MLKKNIIFFFLCVLGNVAFLLCSCGSTKNKNFNALDDLVTDKFSVLSYTTSDEVFFDLIFVVDNSNTMKDNQRKLGVSFQSFIQAFDSQESDFQIGVITTDHYKFHQGLHTGPSKKPLLTQTTPGLKDLFMENAMVSVGGDRHEMGMKSVVDFLESPLKASLFCGLKLTSKWLL